MTFLKMWINKERITKLRCILAIALLLAIISTVNSSYMNRIEDSATRAASMMPFNQEPSKNIAIVTIDTDSIKQFGQWPWNKKNMF